MEPGSPALQADSLPSHSLGSPRKKVKVKSLSCVPTLRHHGCSLPCSSVHGIFQARVLEWVAIAFSRGSSRPRDQTQVSHIVGGALLSEPPGKSQEGEFLTSWTGGSSQLRALLVVGGGDGRRPPIGQMAGQSISCKGFQSLPGRPLSFHQG